MEAFHNFFAGAQESYEGENRPMGAILSYFARDSSAKDSVLISVSDSEGKLIREMRTTAKQGVNRVVWDLKTKSSVVPGEMDAYDKMMMSGAPVFYGDYTVSLKAGNTSQSKTTSILKAPSTPISDEALKENIRRKEAFNQMADQLVEEYKKVEDAMVSMEQVQALVAENKNLKSELEEMQERAETLKWALVPKSSKRIHGDTPDLKSRVLSLAGYYSNPMVEPDENSEIAFKILKTKTEKAQKEIAAFVSDSEALKEKVNRSEISIWK